MLGLWCDYLVLASGGRDRENCGEFTEDRFKKRCIGGWNKSLTIISLLEVYCMA